MFYIMVALVAMRQTLRGVQVQSGDKVHLLEITQRVVGSVLSRGQQEMCSCSLLFKITTEHDVDISYKQIIVNGISAVAIS